MRTQAQSRRKFNEGVSDASPGYVSSGMSKWSRAKAHPTANIKDKPPTTLSRLMEHEMALERLKRKAAIAPTPKMHRDLEAKEKFIKQLRREYEGTKQ